MYIKGLILVLILIFNLAQCQEIIKNTNYTKSYFENTKSLKCESDADCPLYSICDISGKSKECLFMDFKCPGTENSNCYYYNITIWNPSDEVLQKEYNNKKIRPIIKVCDKELIDKKQCETEKCSSDIDCLFGLCYKNSCSTNDNIYDCSGTAIDVNGTMACGKSNGMKCLNNSECSSFDCLDGMCITAPLYPKSWDTVAKVIIKVLIILTVLIIGLIILVILKKKLQKTKN
ncbi:hypothetical protein H8356DRAFT_170572 [Neocallimastix lanati (nom. inval.)]|jgi:hypothetical protein|uniref:Dickkopf N-terminal cysteine-rich domain-containing protein n=1 Tax=Neocallimastix californiae TaxID=1754190 RepID=A0A1Y2AT69_9FUNG|nr:hypothetical protein H8356DRAFT_170572 [Neocallimastix sp. JGI-2020a]ORY25686.1 hypothetical protein LY90DRAFT_674785 [Neocallimastix californiae]|eukprot:ORY25686.1 hypothetical protein LY90DRAFT_674785 [Neocallimastix californiae]